MKVRIVLAGALAVSLAAGAAAPAAEALGSDARVRLAPEVRRQADGTWQIGARGEAGLPDKAVLQIRLLPIEASGDPGLSLRSYRAQVSGGRFAVPAWTLRRDELVCLRYRLEAKLAGDQDPALERGLLRAAARWTGEADFSLDDAFLVAAQVVPVAKALRERVVAVIRHQAEAQERMKGGASSAARQWATRSGFVRDLEQCRGALEAPAAAVVFPRAREKGLEVYSQYEFARNIAGTEDSGRQYRLPEMDLPSTPAGFDAALAAEGFDRLAVAAAAVLAGVAPEGGGAAPVKAETARKALGDLVDQSAAFARLPWSLENVKLREGAFLELVDEIRRVAEAEPAERRPAEARRRLAAFQDAMRGERGAK